MRRNVLNNFTLQGEILAWVSILCKTFEEFCGS